jgi:hypothetical protein
MKRHCLRAALLAMVPALAAAPSAADGASSTDVPATETRVVVVDVDALPEGELPPVPTDKDAPVGVAAWMQPASVTVKFLADEPTIRRKGRQIIHRQKPSAKNAKKKTPSRTRLVELAPTAPSIDAIYAPSADATELEASSTQKMSCSDQASVTLLRWETLAADSSDGNARLEVRDLWFDAKTCAVGPGPIATIRLKAIAWEDGKPWLYAMRSHAGVTLVMPHVNEISSEAMVATPVSVRGDFTRVTMPIGRWGSGSIVAQLDSLSSGPAGDGASRPVEVGIELVQTMSEKAPTLLVRTRRAAPETPEGASAQRGPIAE